VTPVAGEPVYLEVGPRRTFACSLRWPGWCRSGASASDALEALMAYRPRYAGVAASAGLRFAAAAHARPPDVVERLAGNATTDFGAPAAIAAADREAVTPATARRMVALMEAAWATLDAVVADSPATLRKGPRGGGRDRDAMVDHVAAAETAYARKIGVRHRSPGSDRAAWSALRLALADAVGHAGGHSGPDHPWPVPYAVRRIAWHTLDHAWEMEDRRV
jgi:hypothetical protein